ncbi:peptide deformylase [Algicella marina]|uniref:Peptide deformylase n=1 Tax=Algicella marina TaxID=2683284 RepID=A0A6P1T5T7_9RHOB|nr:peptide deformylase [Algicella marina]QHQ37063.1 peptide deformylase [Algicella marina]
MALRPIILHPDARLKKVCPPVEVVDEGLLKLADDMLETMYDAPGVGLAAPQVGVLKRLFVMDCNREDAGKEPTVCINPEITWASETLVTGEEGCLSIPEFYEDVSRPETIRLSYTNRDGERVERELEGLWATCAQHELDHLNGKLFIDYLGAVRRTMITNKMKKVKREKGRV